MPKPIQKVLIANRGEIALRIMRTCRDMGIATVAVYSEADRLLPFVAYADEAVLLGAAPSSESYLRVDKIWRLRKKQGQMLSTRGMGFFLKNVNWPRPASKTAFCLSDPRLFPSI